MAASPCSLASLPFTLPANIDTLPAETIVIHVLPYLTNGEKGALAKTCGRLFRLLRHERVYCLSSLCTRKYLEDAAFREEVDARIPAGKLVLRPFECAIRALHFAPYQFKRARTLFEAALADECATEVEKARAHLSLYVLYEEEWGGPNDDPAEMLHKAAAGASASLLLSARDERDPVRAFEMGYCHWHGIGTNVDRTAAQALFSSSANGGCATSMLFRGVGLFTGWGVSCDEAAGIAQYERAIAMGHYGTMHWYGIKLYYDDDKASRDGARGIALVRSAAVEEGDWGAKDWLELFEDQIKRAGFW